MALGEYKRAVGVFSNRSQTERGVNALRQAGFSMNDISVVAREAGQDDRIAGANVSDKPSLGNKAEEGAVTGVAAGGLLGGLTGLLIGVGALALPGIGPVMAAGALATALATTAAGAGIGAAAGGLLGTLVGLGIPEERARLYQDRIEHGYYLVMVEGTPGEVARAETILRNQGIQDLSTYNAPMGSYQVRNSTPAR
ncbi:MAG: general stress protein [Actinomycetota bacterium]